MNLIQTYYNRHITDNDIDFRGGYQSTLINWLAMAYSCLGLKRHNPDCRLIFYGNRPLVNLLENKFRLPYDEYQVIECQGEYVDWFYAWPKIWVYKEQEDPFIHIDNDIFTWEPLPSRLLQAALVAQHQEKDSTFYMEVYRQLQKDGVSLPPYMKPCFDGAAIHSYNAGLFGGNDVEFLKEYLHNLMQFVDSNKSKIALSDRKFLYNVVFEQWGLYGLSKKNNRRVETYYPQTINNFDMLTESVPRQVLPTSPLRYLHVMEHKDYIRCNRFITYHMAMEHPEIYERILKICHDNGIQGTRINDATSNDIALSFRSDRLREQHGLSDKELSELVKFEQENKELLSQYQRTRDFHISTQKEHLAKLDRLRNNDIRLSEESLKYSDSLHVTYPSSALIQLLLHGTNMTDLSDKVILRKYNAIYNRIDEFIWSRKKYQLLKSLIADANTSKILFLSHHNYKTEQISMFLRQCLFDGIITFA